MAELKDYSFEELLEWLKGLEISEKSMKAIADAKMIGEELVDAETDELIDEGVSEEDIKKIVRAVESFVPSAGGDGKAEDDAKDAPEKKENPEKVRLKAELAKAEKEYKDLGDLKKVMSSISMPVGYIMQYTEELKKLPEEKRGPTQKKFTMMVKKRDEILKKLRDIRAKFPDNSENWRAIAEVHEGSMQVMNAMTNFNFGKMVTTHTSRIFREQRSAMARLKDAKKALKAFDQPA
mmetsp:Transcript_6916/g.12716  ORF Transcript_6916/g.12716 Transcript_6916/m.12716 type:complete len:236 (-) Transcript_6916:117-824(-)